MKRSFNSCSVPFNPFTQKRQSIEQLVPRFYYSNVSNMSFHRKLLNILLMPFCVTQRLSLGDQLLMGVENLDIGISYYKGRWIITNGLYITPYTIEDVLNVIGTVKEFWPVTMRHRIVTITLRLDYRYCPKRNIRVLFDRYEEDLFRKGALINAVYYPWKQNFFARFRERFNQFIKEAFV